MAVGADGETERNVAAHVSGRGGVFRHGTVGWLGAGDCGGDGLGGD